MIFADIDLLLSYKLLKPLLRLFIKHNIESEESFSLNRKEFRVMRWFRKQIWGKTDFLRSIEDDTYEQVRKLAWFYTSKFCSFIMQRRKKEEDKLLEDEEDDTIKEQISELRDLVQSLKTAFDNTRYVLCDLLIGH